MSSVISPKARMSWHHLPAEIRVMVLEEVWHSGGCQLASLATVSREWQAILEPRIFSRIKLTPLRIANLNYMVRRCRSYVHYIWFSYELPRYDCDECAPQTWNMSRLTREDNLAIVAAVGNLFAALSEWEPKGDLLLDISIHSPSDSEHWFKELTFGPDLPPGEDNLAKCIEQSTTHPVDHHDHEWIAGNGSTLPIARALDKVFQEVMDGGTFHSPREEIEWWKVLPEVPAVTGVLFRQQNRRTWTPYVLRQMFHRFPRLQEIHYEPWMDWDQDQQKLRDILYPILFGTLVRSNIRRLTVFENFDEDYPLHLARDLIRVPDREVSRKFASISRKLEYLSASFIVDASHFLVDREQYQWPFLTSVALTSRLLTPDGDPTEIGKMLQEAAEAAMKMPKLRTLEIWNGRKGLAGLFAYHFTEHRRPAVLTWRGTWTFVVHPHLVRAWESVALKHGGHGCDVVEELLDVDINCHGDAIHYLRLSNLVVRPISLQQIRMEHRARKRVSNA
ncbi:hypothetical protein F4778DRAFT_542154 [Xylariomycetidae sp. FL2044]|nr:hypothetical protein F4778DRAFT_542154 [Xylariomycetidae sp. FL2044]